MKSKAKNSAQWTSSFGFIASSVGAAVGLGNIWGFPYRMGECGGFAFIVFYIVFVLLTGLPVLLAEFAIGRRGGASAPRAYAVFGRRFTIAGIASIAACMIILSYYCFFGGMLLQKVFEAFGVYFGSGVFWTLTFAAVSACIVFSGVQRGIEKFSKLMIPVLLIMLIFIVCCTLSSKESRSALRLILTPRAEDFNARCASSALTQVFFSMSLGQGCMLVYGAYAGRHMNLWEKTWLIPFFDTLTAILAAFAILPAAMAQGIDPGSGPSLMFNAVPKIFSAYAGGEILTLMFFMLVLLAAVTSVVSMIETPAAAISEGGKISRGGAVVLVSAVAFFMGLPVCLSYGSGFSWLKIYEFISEYILIIMVSLFSCAAVGIVWKKRAIPAVFDKDNCFFGRAWLFILKYVTPSLLLCVILSFLFSLRS